MKKLGSWVVLVLITAVVACSGKESSETDSGKLPVLGHSYINEFEMEGKMVKDTIYHKIADFSFVNQVGTTITNADVTGKVYIADFFFTTCPTICPTMKAQMLRVYEKFKDNPDFQILSHSIDPTHDTQEVLKEYAERIGIEDASTWHFLTGDQEKIFEIGQTSYLTTAMEDQNEPGGFLHSGAFILIDQQGRIRGLYDGTKEDQVNRLMNDIPKLLP
ncbi:SCO family protein [Mongoliitalea daihaiensis]|uniref:SCO family protein n=1 Tax=Mongoliitalea daihaiensis TaxID=2782006 RepID=UPI001F23F27C|nr:SCO family protein [Mongoliitalea daihaiensis]UJP64989.1 SCO family protein [Mongoliitalea daihaiensis]